MTVTVTDTATPPHARTVADVLDFATPPPGLRDLRTFSLAAVDDTGYLFTLRSTQEPDVRLFLVPPRAYFPDYAPELDGSTRETLGTDDAVLLVVVHPGQGDAPPTANLLAPVAVNASTGTALQVVLDDDRWPLRAPLTAA
ncbi:MULTISPECIES: flagellar assembly protein FliW [unclassified Actinotalea]|uniref:flagellar assembly protein FliW n=1 Tax=unclassified Actinotalea TaxID=2638618 RepID=UPI0015F6897C|nr:MULTISPECIES: flagellar assembly protein FliW [unclassified Actinotalea]